jgi:hypothetical protein
VIIRNKEHLIQNISVMDYIFIFLTVFLFKKSSNDRLSSSVLSKEYVSIWNWIEKYRPNNYLQLKKERLQNLLLMMKR